MTESHIRNVIEAALLAAGKPLQAAELVDLFDDGAERPTLSGVQAALAALAEEYSTRGIEIKETAAGFRIQVRVGLSNEISRLWPERPAKYSRALLETLAIIAYRQPITRAEIEAVRGVAVNPNIIKTVIERNWVHVVGHRDVPGRPELLSTTRDFLDYFGLKRLDELPPLAELKAIGEIKMQFDLPDPGPLALASDAAVEPGAAGENADAAVGEVAAGEVATGEAANAVASNTESGNAEGAAAGEPGGDVLTGEAFNAADVGDAEAAKTDTAVDATAAAGDAEATPVAGENAANEHASDGSAAEASADHTSGQAVFAGELTAETASAGESGAAHATAGETSADGSGDTVNTAEASSKPAAAADAPAHNAEASEKVAPSSGRGSGRKKKRGKLQASDSALHEAEEFAASVDADLAAGDDDGADEDELSAASPDSSELVAGPRDIDQ